MIGFTNAEDKSKKIVLVERGNCEIVQKAKKAQAAGAIAIVIFDNQDGGTVIGASIMREREVIFDISESTITFVDADCNRITPATSYMRGAFSFDTCPAKNDSTSMSGAHPAPSTPVAPSSPGPYSVGSRWPLGAPAAASGRGSRASAQARRLPLGGRTGTP